MILTATRPVLYRAKLYGAGEQLPTDDSAMVDAWLEAGSARRVDETAGSAKKTARAKARKASATPAAEGRSDTGTVEQGRVPEDGSRKKGKRK